MSQLYTKISKELDAQIEDIAKERGMKKTDVVRELLEDGFKADGMISEAKAMKAKVLALDTVKDDISELKEKIASLEAMLESRSVVKSESVELPAPRLTKEEVIKHLQTCTDPNCDYGLIAAAVRDLDGREVLVVGDKTFPIEQVGSAKEYALEFAKLHDQKVDIVYRKGNFTSKPFKSSLFGSFEDDFNYGLEWAKEEAQKEAKRLEEAQRK